MDFAWPYPLSLLLFNPAAAPKEESVDEIEPTDALEVAAPSSVMVEDTRAHRPGPLDSAYYRVQAGPATCYIHGTPFACTLTLVDGIPMTTATAAAFVRMREAARAAGVNLRAVSGFRTMEHQRALYAAYQAHTGPLAAVPGFSNHQSGVAVDLNTPDDGVLWWLNHNAARFGFRRTIRAEGWHWEHG